MGTIRKAYCKKLKNGNFVMGNPGTLKISIDKQDTEDGGKAGSWMAQLEIHGQPSGTASASGQGITPEAAVRDLLKQHISGDKLESLMDEIELALKNCSEYGTVPLSAW